MSAGDGDQKNRDQYRDLVGSSPDGIVLCQDSVVTFANGAAARLLGASNPDQILGKSLFERFRSPAPWSQLEVKVVQPPDQAAIQLTLRDITDRMRAEGTVRENEERLTLAFSGAQEGVWDWDLATGKVVYSSR